jgi:hypothetical protein
MPLSPDLSLKVEEELLNYSNSCFRFGMVELWFCIIIPILIMMFSTSAQDKIGVGSILWFMFWGILCFFNLKNYNRVSKLRVEVRKELNPQANSK